MHVIKHEWDLLSEEFLLSFSASLGAFGSAGVHQRVVGWVIASPLAFAARQPFLDLLPMNIIIPPKSIDRV